MSPELKALFDDLSHALFLTKLLLWYDARALANLEEIDAICALIALKIALPVTPMPTVEAYENTEYPPLTN
jgi:hypothetical protein